MTDKPLKVHVLDSDDVYDRQFSAPHNASQYDIALGDVLTLCEDWVVVRDGQLDAQAVAIMEEREYDFAPALCSFGFYVASRAMLSELNRTGASLTPESAFEETTFLRFNDYYVSPRELFEGLSDCKAAIVALPGIVTESEITIHIAGFITRSDLNRKSVRKPIYEMLLDLETSLAELIETTHFVDSEWIVFLADDAKAKVLGYKALTSLKGFNVSAIAATNLADLFKIAAKSELVREALGFPKRKYAESVINRINTLRNKIMHPVRPLILSDEDVSEVREALVSITDLLRRLRELRKLAMARGKHADS